MACGSQQAEGLEAKKAQLKSLRSDLVRINEEVKTLEQEIAELDPESQKRSSRIPVITQELKPRQFQHFIEVQGQVEAKQNVLVSPKMAGNLTNILVREGQYVKKDQILAVIDDAMAKRSIEEVQTQFELANTLYLKQKNLWEKEIGTEVQYLTAKNQKESLEKRMATLKEQLKMTRIQAPISGTIDEVMPKIGEAVAPGMPAFRIVNVADLTLAAEVSEAYIPYIKTGQMVDLEFPTINKSLKARISSVGKSIHPNDRTFSVEVKLPNDPLFRANMFGDITINDRTLEQAIAVPISVVQRSEKGEFVYVAKQNPDGAWVAQRKMIRTGLSAEGDIEVTEGLSEGEFLITNGFKDLNEGQALDIQSS